MKKYKKTFVYRSTNTNIYGAFTVLFKKKNLNQSTKDPNNPVKLTAQLGNCAR